MCKPWLHFNWIDNTAIDKDGYIILKHRCNKGDVIKILFPQKFYLQPANDDSNMVALFHGPVLLAGELGNAKMPGKDLVKQAHFIYREWVSPTDDIPILIANGKRISEWIEPVKGKTFCYQVNNEAKLHGKNVPLSLIPFYLLRYQRQNIYFKLFSPQQWITRKQVISDEVNTGDASDEKRHLISGEKTDTTRYKDNSNFWENNRVARFAKDGGSFNYSMKINKAAAKNYLSVTYWSGEPANAEFDVIVNDEVLKSENISKKTPLTFYDEVYEVPTSLTTGKNNITVSFKAKPSKNTGKVYGLKITGNPDLFGGYLFY